MPSRAPGPSANAAAASCSCARSAAKVSWRDRPGPASTVTTGWRSRRGRPPGTPATSRPASLLRGSTTPCRYLLRIARSSGSRRASDPTSERGQRPGGQRALAEEVAVQDRVLEHADLLGGGQRRLQLLVVAAGRGGRRAQVGEALQQDVEQRRRHVQLDLVAAQQFLGAEPDDLRLALLVGHHRDAHEVEAALERRGQVVDAPVAAVGGGDDGEAGLGEDDVVARRSSGTEMYFSDRIEISASCTSLVERVSSSKRPIAPASIAVMIGEGIIDSRDWPLAMTMDTFHEYLMWSSVVPAVPCTTSVELRLMAAASSSASQLLPVPGSPISSRPRSEARVTMAALDEAAVAEPLLRDLPVQAVGALGAEDEQPDHLRRQPPGERLGAVVDGLEPVQLLGVLDLGGGAQQVGHVRAFHGRLKRGTS